MPIMTMACIHNHYAECTSKLCDCECHPRNKTASLVTHAREAAHQAVKAFDRAPGDATARHAIEALTEYRMLLANTSSGPLVPPQKSCPTRLMDGRNEIRCWLNEGHEGDCK